MAEIEGVGLTRKAGTEVEAMDELMQGDTLVVHGTPSSSTATESKEMAEPVVVPSSTSQASLLPQLEASVERLKL